MTLLTGAICVIAGTAIAWAWAGGAEGDVVGAPLDVTAGVVMTLAVGSQDQPADSI